MIVTAADMGEQPAIKLLDPDGIYPKFDPSFRFEEVPWSSYSANSKTHLPHV